MDVQNLKWHPAVLNQANIVCGCGMLKTDVCKKKLKYSSAVEEMLFVIVLCVCCVCVCVRVCMCVCVHVCVCVC